MEKLFGINYDDPGTITKFKNEQEIEKLGWLSSVEEGLADVFRMEVTASNEPLLRRALVEKAEVDVGEGPDTEKALTIVDWELVA